MRNSKAGLATRQHYDLLQDGFCRLVPFLAYLLELVSSEAAKSHVVT